MRTEKGQTRKREADQINDCFTRSSLRERRWLSSRERAKRRNWKRRETCRVRNHGASCVILTLGARKRRKRGVRRRAGEIGKRSKRFRARRELFSGASLANKMWRIKTSSWVFVAFVWSPGFLTHTHYRAIYNKCCFLFVYYSYWRFYQ